MIRVRVSPGGRRYIAAPTLVFVEVPVEGDRYLKFPVRNARFAENEFGELSLVPAGQCSAVIIEVGHFKQFKPISGIFTWYQAGKFLLINAIENEMHFKVDGKYSIRRLYRKEEPHDECGEEVVE